MGIPVKFPNVIGAQTNRLMPLAEGEISLTVCVFV